MTTLQTISDQSTITNYPAVLVLIALSVFAVLVHNRRAEVRRRGVEAAKRRHPSAQARVRRPDAADQALARYTQRAKDLGYEPTPRRRRYDQCNDTCTVDCGHCKWCGPPS